MNWIEVKSLSIIVIVWERRFVDAYWPETVGVDETQERSFTWRQTWDQGKPWRMVACSGQEEKEVQTRDIRAEPTYYSVSKPKENFKEKVMFSWQIFSKNRNLAKMIGCRDWILKDQRWSPLPGGQWAPGLLSREWAFWRITEVKGLSPAWSWVWCWCQENQEACQGIRW